jgi:hypothetical protein
MDLGDTAGNGQFLFRMNPDAFRAYLPLAQDLARGA